MATFLLVHGAWHGGWCWQRVVPILQEAGHTVHAPTLTGVCERSHLADLPVNLTTHVMDVVNEIKWKELNDIVLCGHSYGGMVITGAIEKCRDAVASIVYLDAFLPESGQCLDDIMGQSHPDVNGMVKPITAEMFCVNPADRAWVDAQTTPQSAACFSERLTLSGVLGEIRNKTYVKANIGTAPPFQANFDRLSKLPDWQCHSLDCGHDAMIDMPNEVAEILLAAI